MKLYEIDDSIERVLNEHTDHETGEITEAGIQALDALELDRSRILLFLGRVILGERTEAAAVKLEVERLQTRQRIHAGRAERLLAYCQMHAQKDLPRDEIVTFGWGPPAADGTELPKEERFRRIKIEELPDKRAIREALAKGEEIPGWRLIRRLSVK